MWIMRRLRVKPAMTKRVFDNFTHSLVPHSFGRHDEGLEFRRIMSSEAVRNDASETQASPNPSKGGECIGQQNMKKNNQRKF
jgi:hypothetical protein